MIDQELLWKAWPDGFFAARGVLTVGGWRCWGILPWGSRPYPAPVWVNPDAPGESIIDRDIRWGLVGFKSIFLFVFGGVGL